MDLGLGDLIEPALQRAECSLAGASRAAYVHRVHQRGMRPFRRGQRESCVEPGKVQQKAQDTSSAKVQIETDMSSLLS